MFAQSRRPAPRNGMRTTEQAGVCTDARESPRTREVDKGQGFGRLQIGKMTLVELSPSYRADSSRLAKRFDEGAMLIKGHIQYAETPIRRVKPVSGGLAENDWPFVSIVDTREDGPGHRFKE